MPRRLSKKSFQQVQRIEAALKRHGVQTGDSVVVGVSGGADSVCLLYLLNEVSAYFPLQLHVVHLDHGLRGEESLQDALFVEKLAEKLGLLVTCQEVNVLALSRQRKISVETAARQARYAFFEQVAEKRQSPWVALGHTANDQAETLLQRFLRGSGMLGLSAMAPVRRLNSQGPSQCQVIRPLLGFRREEILAYLNASSISYREDSSNHDKQFLRNHIRRDALPYLISEYNPALIETLNRTADLLREDQEWMRSQVLKVLPSLEVKCSFESGSVFSRSGLLKLHTALQRGVLREVFCQAKGVLLDLSYEHIELARQLLCEGKAGDSLHLARGLKLRMLYDQWWVYDDSDLPEHLKAIDLPVPGEIAVPSLDCSVKVSIQQGYVESDARCRAVFDYEQIFAPFVLRKRSPGDYFFPMGMGGKKKKLQDFFVDRKIPRHERDRVPLLTSPQGVLWVMGWQLDERYVAQQGSKKTIVVELQRTGEG